MSSLEEPKFLQRLGEELLPKRPLTPKQQLEQEITKNHEMEEITIPQKDIAEQEVAEQEEEEEVVEEPAVTLLAWQEDNTEQEAIATLEAVEADIRKMMEHQDRSYLEELPIEEFEEFSDCYQQGDVLLQLHSFHYLLPVFGEIQDSSESSDFSGEEYPAVEELPPQPEVEEGEEESKEQGYLPILEIEFPEELQGKRKKFNWRQTSWRDSSRRSECE